MLRPIQKLRLPDRPHHATVSGNGLRFAACAESGTCWFFDNDLRQLDEFRFGTGVTWMQLNETGSLLLVGFDDHVDGFATTGNITPKLKLPLQGTSDPCCVFSTNEDVACVASWRREPKLTAWDLVQGTLIDEAPLPERGGAGYLLIGHPEGEAMAAIAYSGQSEEWLFWTHYARGKVRVFTQPEIEDVCCPCFHPTGREFVSYHERFGLCRMRFPTGELIASISTMEAFPQDPEDVFSYDVHFFRDDRVLAWQCNLALYEFDLATLKPTATVLTGAEGMTFGTDLFFSEQSWKLAGNRLLTSDCQHDRSFP